MPLYEYQCEACSHRFERIQKFSDPPIASCPTCGGAVRKLISSPAIQFKGTGWYITDYARSGKSDAGKSEGSAAGSSETKSETKTDAKAETKTESKADSKGTP
jgi:putative FmdB family regulatory protein